MDEWERLLEVIEDLQQQTDEEFWGPLPGPKRSNKMNKNNIKETCKNFLEDWDRHEWMAAHGEWASSEWDEERKEYEEAAAALVAAAAALPNSDRAQPSALSELKEAYDRLREAAEALDGQVRPDESDYIAEGLLDPDGVADDAEALDAKDGWQGWDCTEGWRAYRRGRDLYINWWRNAYGNRHSRDLWVLVDKDFFEA